MAARSRRVTHGRNDGGLGLSRCRTMQDFGEFGGLDVLELFAALFELLEGLDDGLGHAAVRLFGTADNGELFAGGDALVAVLMVEADAEEGGGRGQFFLFAHAVTVSATGRLSSGISASTALQTMSANASS